jgi:hypothetical protein
MHLGASQSLQDLTVAGIDPALFAVPGYLFVLANAWMLYTPFKARKAISRVRTRPRLKAVLIAGVSVVMVALVVWLVALTLLIPFLTAVYALATVVVGGVWLRFIYRKRRSLRAAWTWPILLASLVVGTVFVGLDYRDVPVADYTFDSSAGAPSGWYRELGRSDGTVYLLSCTDSKGAVVGVSPASIRLTQYGPQAANTVQISLLDLLAGRAPVPFGLQNLCP